MVNSWDCWDTLVSRRLMRPSDLFDVVGHIMNCPDFPRKRIEAERKARLNRNEVTLEQIYLEMSYDSDLLERLKQTELNLELEMSFPIVINVRKMDARDLILTDIYFSKDFVLQVLEKTNVEARPENVFVSSELGFTKASGVLFEIAKNKNDIVKHVGDNPKSDYINAKRNGIDAEIYKESMANTSIEEKWYASGDLNSKLIAGALRATRLTLSPKITELGLFYSQVLAPLLVGFCEYVLSESLKKEIKVLFFLARDGNILYKISKLLVESRSLDISCVYMYASRQALHLPGYMNMSDASSWIFEDRKNLTLSKVSKRTEVACEEIKAILRDLGFDDIDENSILSDSLILLLSESEAFHEQVSLNSLKRFEFAQKYFSKIGILDCIRDDNRIGIVDVGWRGRLQDSFKKIIEKSGLNSSMLHGFYLGLRDASPTIYSSANGYLYDQSSSSNKVSKSWIMRYANVIEYFIKAAHPQVLSYSKSEQGVDFGMPVCLDSVALINERERAILCFTRNYTSQVKLKDDLSLSGDRRAVSFFAQSLSTPSYNVVVGLKGGEHSAEQFEEGMEAFIKTIGLRELIFRKWHVLGYWPEASAAYARLGWALKLRQMLMSISSRRCSIFFSLLGIIFFCSMLECF